jgi:tripartite-type tricarboxylate transporter receptor subunit TctC
MWKKMVAMASIAMAAAAGAQSFPGKPITLIVPFSAGGPTDVVARSLGVGMGKALGQPVVVENRASSGGIVGSEFVLRSEPDGHTLLIHNIGMATLPSLVRKLRFDPLKDFAYVGEVVDVPMTLVGRKNLGPGGYAQLESYLRANEKKVNIGNAGVGTASHLCSLLLMRRLNLPLTSVPYKGAAPAMTDLIGGQIDLLCDQVTTTTQPIRTGMVKAYGATTSERLGTLPEVPTLAEQGLGDMQISVWHGIYAPKGTPPKIVEQLARALRTALADESFADAMKKLGALPASRDRASPEGLHRHLQQEIDRWTPIIQGAQIFIE